MKKKSILKFFIKFALILESFFLDIFELKFTPAYNPIKINRKCQYFKFILNQIHNRVDAKNRKVPPACRHPFHYIRKMGGHTYINKHLTYYYIKWNDRNS